MTKIVTLLILISRLDLAPKRVRTVTILDVTVRSDTNGSPTTV
nr:MAG TPA: hypothetical protein [Microviridae sp.]